MSTITRLFLVGMLVPGAAQSQSDEAALRQIPVFALTSTDRGRVIDRATWSLAESPDGRFVAFTLHDDTIRVYDRRTRAVGLIPNATRFAAELAWSRRGDMISFAKPGEDGRIAYPWIVPVNPQTGQATGPARQLSLRPITRWDDAPTFSPDDRYAAFPSFRGDSGFVVVAPSNGGRERELYGGRGFVTRAIVSRDGRWVYFTFTSGSGAPQSLYRVAFGGGPAQRLADHVAFFIGVSADGSQLAWYGAGHPRAAANATIVIADASGKPLGVIRNPDAQIKSWSSKPGVLLGKRVELMFRTRAISPSGRIRELGSSGLHERPLAWSPDGRMLLSNSSTEPGALVLVSSTGDTLHRIQGPPIARVLGEDSRPVWSPDARFVAYRAATADGQRPQGRIMLIDARSGATRTLVESVHVGAFRWRADAQAIRYIEGNGDLSYLETTLAGGTTVLARNFTTKSRGVPQPITDSTVLVVTHDSTYIVSSRGAFVRTLPQLPSARWSMQPSPDGQLVAFIDASRQRKHAVQLVPTDGGPAHTLAFDLDYTIFEPHFAGNMLAFLGNAMSAGAPHGTDLFAIPLAGGVPRNLTAADSMTDVDFVTASQDGTIAYQAELGWTAPTRVIDIDVQSVKRTPNVPK